MAYLRDLSETFRTYWHTPSVIGLGVVLLVIVYLASKTVDDYNRSIPEGGRAVEATIASLSDGRTRLLGKQPGVVVTARTSEGAIGKVVAIPQEIRGCEPGDRIEAV